MKNILENLVDTYTCLRILKETLEKRDSRDMESTSSCGEIFFENQLVWKISFRSPSGEKERSTLPIPIGRN